MSTVSQCSQLSSQSWYHSSRHQVGQCVARTQWRGEIDRLWFLRPGDARLHKARDHGRHSILDGSRNGFKVRFYWAGKFPLHEVYDARIAYGRYETMIVIIFWKGFWKWSVVDKFDYSILIQTYIVWRYWVRNIFFYGELKINTFKLKCSTSRFFYLFHFETVAKAYC